MSGSDYNEQYTPYGTLKRVPNDDIENRIWVDSRLRWHDHQDYKRHYPVLVILNPQDQRKLRQTQIQDLSLKSCLDNTVFTSKSQVLCVCYLCKCQIFYYKDDRGDGCFNYPKTCPLGHPAYDE